MTTDNNAVTTGPATNSRITKTKFHIPDSNPFENDKLNREYEIINLTSLIEKMEDPFVLCVDSSWGTGKTTFIKMWESYLKSKNHNSIYFNAWENDYHDDAFLVIVGELCIKLYELGINLGIYSTNEDSKISELKKIAGKLFKNSVTAVISNLTGGILDENVIKQFSNIEENINKEKLNNYEQKRKDKNEFEQLLKNIIYEIRIKQKTETPLIIFVDELDRCRPDFSVELLEKIKHFFEIPGLVFVLATDKEQLCNSITTIYGQNIKPEVYLRKFIDLEYNLAQPKEKRLIDSLIESNKLYQGPRTDGSLEYFIKNIYDIVITNKKIHNLSHRDVEQLFTEASICCKLLPSITQWHKYSILILLILKQNAPIFFDSFLQNNFNIQSYLDSYSQTEYFDKKTELILSFLAKSHQGQANHIFNNLMQSDVRLTVEHLNSKKELTNFVTKVKVQSDSDEFRMELRKVLKFSNNFE